MVKIILKYQLLSVFFLLFTLPVFFSTLASSQIIFLLAVNGVYSSKIMKNKKDFPLSYRCLEVGTVSNHRTTYTQP